MFEGFKQAEIQTSDPECKINLRYGGSGPPVLLLHGNPLTLVTWYLIAPRLARTGPGLHGRRSHPDGR